MDDTNGKHDVRTDTETNEVTIQETPGTEICANAKTNTNHEMRAKKSASQ